MAAQTLIYQIDLSSNNFEGSIPAHLFSMPGLQFLDLHDNRLNGAIPELLVWNDILLFLSIHDNSITGQLPITIAKMRALLHLDGR
jgi:Leucine-rich repeat (LRR) protein